MDVKEIKDPSFLKDLSIKELENLSEDIRKFIIEKVSKNGGHLSGNLGIVELTIALHKFFNEGEKFIFDVGHQCYTHKILTGRATEFDNLRKKNGISGFPSKDESLFDVWEVAHASTSLACLSGMLESNQKAIAVIGDGALTGGEAIEALEYLSTINKQAIIILNDNSFSISKNVGFIRKVLDNIRSSRGYSNLSLKYRKNNFLKNIKNSVKRIFYKNTIFDEMGFKYYGPINGHDYKELFKYFEYAKKQKRPVLLHVVTKKGKGYSYAEDDMLGLWHSVPPFDIETGKQFDRNDDFISYSEALSIYLSKFYKKYNNLKVIMPAMTAPSKMVELKDEMKENFIDTGITEPFSLSFSSALSMCNNNVCIPIYSSFLQRGYDQLHQDISMQKNKVVIAVDKCGFVSGNGKTHQGIYDISYLSTIPNLKICAPKDMKELFELMDYAFLNNDSPIAIHLPCDNTKINKNLEVGESKIKESWTKEFNLNDPKIYLVTYSNLYNYIKDTIKDLNVELVNARFINPLDKDILKEMAESSAKIVVYEEAPSITSLQSIILSYYNEIGINKRIYSFGLPLDFVDIGTNEELRKEYKLDKESVKDRLKELLCD